MFRAPFASFAFPLCHLGLFRFRPFLQVRWSPRVRPPLPQVAAPLRLATCGADGRVRAWAVGGAAPPWEARPPVDERPAELAWRPDGVALLTASRAAAAPLAWEVAGGGGWSAWFVERERGEAMRQGPGSSPADEAGELGNGVVTGPGATNAARISSHASFGDAGALTSSSAVLAPRPLPERSVAFLADPTLRLRRGTAALAAAPGRSALVVLGDDDGGVTVAAWR